MARARPSSPPDPLDRLVGEAPALQTLRAQITHLAGFDAVGRAVVPTVLLQGETGTGKGLVAHVIHDAGPRASGPFIEVNCAAIPESLLEAELFGFEAGAFTDAKRAKPGLFEAASGGSLFLDEIEALPLPLQGKLLTAIEAKRVRRVGAVVEHAVDVKLVAATQVELSVQVQAGHFRADLYHRLAVVVLELPPLRARGDDILVLARAFLQQYGAAYGAGPRRLSTAAEEWLIGQPWPGNVRELSHLLERAVLLEPATVIDPESLARLCLPQQVPEAAPVAHPAPTPGVPLHERDRLAEALRQSGGNLAAAARLLGLSRGGLRHRLHKHGLTRASISLSSPPVREERDGQDTPANCTAHPSLTPTKGAEPSWVSAPEPRQDQSEPAVPEQNGRPVGQERDPATEPAGWASKPVAVLAIEATWPGVSESVVGPYEPWTVVSRWEQRLAEKVAGFGGVILQGSASLLLVAFGLPRTLEQLPQRAVQAALAIRQLAEAAVPPTGGLTGPVVRLAGHLGTLLVAEGTHAPTHRWLALGETLSLPVRLLGHAAPGEVLVTSSMARLTDGWVELQPRALPSGVDSTDPLLAHRVVGLLPPSPPHVRTGRRSRTPFLGRARELETLQAVLDQVERGRGQVVGIVGEPGTGKSRLLREWRQGLMARGVTYLEGNCWSYGTAMPYLPVLDLLRACCDIRLTDDAGIMIDKVRAALAMEDLAEGSGAPYPLHLLGVPSETMRLKEIGPERLKAKTFEALRRLCLVRSQQQPLILAVEDLHWIDPTSEAFFVHLVDGIAGAPILMLATYRPGYRPLWLDKSYATQLTLSSLSPTDSVRLVQAVLKTETVPGPMAQTILARAQGNPFFLEEIAQALVDEGTGGRESPLRLSAVNRLPATVQGVLGARIDRLAPEDRRLLQTAAVLGPQVPLPLLQGIAETPAEVLHSALTRLQAAELLHETQLFPEREFSFKHVLTHEVAYSNLLPERRRELHARIVTVIEALAPERLTEQVERLAHHAVRGEVWRKAVTYGQQAGARARDRAAFHEAVTYFEQALQALAHLHEPGDTRDLAFDLRLVLADTLTQLGEYGRSRPLLGEAEARARVLDDRARLGQVLAQTANGLRTTGDLDRAIAVGQQALALAVELGESALQVQTCHRLGQVYAASGDFGRAAALLRRNVEAANWEPGRSNTGVRLHSQAWLAWTLGVLGAFAEGRRHGEEALRLATMEGRGAAPIVVRSRLGHLYLAQGDLAHAIEVFDQGLALCRVSGHRNSWRLIVAGLGSAYALQGRLAEGHALLEEALSESIRTGARTPRWLAWCSEVCRLAGRSEETWQHAHQALDLARQQKARGDEALALHQLGTVYAHADPPDADQAEAYYQHALTLAEALGMRPLQAHCHLGLGTLYVLIGRSEQACAQLSAAIKLYRTMDMTFWIPRAEGALAQVVGARGQ